MDTSWFTPTFLFCFLNLTIVTLFLASYSKSHNPKPQLGPNNSSQLVRSSSLLARVKSINFSFRSLDSQYSVQQRQENEPKITDSHDPGYDHQVRALATLESVPVAMSKKSASDKPVITGREREEEVLAKLPATVRERKSKVVEREALKTMSFKGDEGVDAKADDFISKFRQQLKLQRLDSMKRFTEMLARGTGATK